MTNIDAGTAISIEMSNAVPQQLLMAAAARRRKQQQQQQECVLAGRKRPFTATTNAFGDSEDEAEGGEDEDGDADDDSAFAEDPEGVGVSSGITSGGLLDLFKLRQTKRHNVA